MRSRARYDGRRYPPLNDVVGKATPFIYVGPTLLLVVVFLLYPLLGVFGYGFMDWSGLGKYRLIGFKNYVSLLSDGNFLTAFKANGIYIIFFSLAPVTIGLLLASLIGRTQTPGERAFRAILLTPQVIASVAMGIIFGWIFAPSFGVVNSFLSVIGLESLQRPWLGSQVLAPISVGLVGTWLWLGFAVLVFLAGIKKIDESLFDSAKLDGASALKQLAHITLPQLRPEIVVVVVMTLIWSFGSSVFGIVLSITNGGYQTTPVSLYAYQLAFVQARMGYGSAVTVLLMILIVVLSVVTFRVGEGKRW